MAHQNKTDPKVARGHLKGQITKAISLVNRLMKSDENLDAIKVKLDDFDQLVTKFFAVHKSYTDSLTSTAEQCDSEEYVLTLREDIDSFRWAVRTWMKQAAEREMAVLQREITNITQEIEMNLSGQHGPAPRRDATAAAAAPCSEFYHSTPASRPVNSNAVEVPPTAANPPLRPSWGSSPVHHTPASQDLKDILRQVLDESRVQSQLMMDKANMPKTELLCFDGDPLKYYPFMCSFDYAVDSKSR